MKKSAIFLLSSLALACAFSAAGEGGTGWAGDPDPIPFIIRIGNPLYPPPPPPPPPPQP